MTNQKVPHRSSESKIAAYQRVEAILEEGPFVGTRVVHRAYFLYSLRWSQVGARIHEMNDAGWSIASVPLPESEWQSGIRTGYRLDSKPLRAARPLPESDFMRRRREEQSAAMPLFAESNR
jgi:hypothetical protein